MRITGGAFCRRKIKVPAGDKIRPTQDRVREALFSILLNRISGARFIDLYGGSGAVGLEAYSRGAEHVVWVEKSPRHAKLLRQNADLLVPGQGEVVCADVERWLKTAGSGRVADIAFADPPYLEAKDRGFSGIIGLVAENNVVAQGGLFIAEMPAGCKVDEVEGWELIRDKSYGHTRIAIYERKVDLCRK